MTPEEWKRVEDLFEEAKDLPAEDRDLLLRERCGDDQELKREVASLLHFHGVHAGAFNLDESPWNISPGDAAKPPTFSSGVSFGSYIILSLLGSGGMGDVYLAEDTRLRRRVALKLLPAWLNWDEQHVARFRQEAFAASALNHPNVPVVYEAGEIDQRHYIASEYVDGCSLDRRLAEGLVSWREAIGICLQMTRALEVAHAAGIIHRDIKPGNILVAQDGTVKLADFGIAKMAAALATAPREGPSLTRKGMVIGTPGYMAPEQAAGEQVDARCDLWSLAAVLSQAVTGTLPATGRARIRTTRNLPRRLARVIERALQPDPEKRYATAGELAEALEAVRRPRRVGWAIAGAAAPIAILGIAATRFGIFPAFNLGNAAALTGKDSIVLADFANSTGEPVFDDSLKQGLEVDLQQSKFLNLLSNERIKEQLQYMGLPQDQSLTPAVAIEVGKRAGSKAVLFSSIAPLGSHYLITLKAVNCQNSELLDGEQGETDRRETVLKELHALASRLRHRLGETMESIRSTDTPLEMATTSSLEALKAWSLATRASWPRLNVNEVVGRN